MTSLSVGILDVPLAKKCFAELKGKRRDLTVVLQRWAHIHSWRREQEQVFTFPQWQDYKTISEEGNLINFN